MWARGAGSPRVSVEVDPSPAYATCSWVPQLIAFLGQILDPCLPGRPVLARQVLGRAPVA